MGSRGWGQTERSDHVSSERALDWIFGRIPGDEQDPSRSRDRPSPEMLPPSKRFAPKRQAAYFPPCRAPPCATLRHDGAFPPALARPPESKQNSPNGGGLARRLATSRGHPAWSGFARHG